MTVSYTTAARNAGLDAITAAIGNAGKLRVYAGSVPNVGDAISSQTLLAELTCGSPFAPAASEAVLTPNAVTPDSDADATGTPTFFRITTSGGTTVLQGTAGASGCDLNIAGLASGQVIAGGVFTCSLAPING